MSPRITYWLRLVFMSAAASLGPFVPIIPLPGQNYAAAAMGSLAALAALFTIPMPTDLKTTAAATPAPSQPVMQQPVSGPAELVRVLQKS